MTTTYETNVDLILTELDALLKEITAFGNRVYKGFYKDMGDTYPACLYMPTHDRPRVAAMRNDHFITVDLLIFLQGGENTPDVDVDSVVSLAGEVYEKLETAQDKTWRLLTIGDVNFAFNRDKSLIFYCCYMTLLFEKRW